MTHPLPHPDRAGPDLFGRWPGLWATGLFLAALLVYGPALGGALLWDDAGHVTAPGLRSLDGLVRIWFEPGATQQYYPVLHSAFWLEHRLWGDATLGYHVMNVLQHTTAAFLFAVLLRRLAVPGALFAAACFALHPVCVESVAWISEQKNTLSTVFSLAAALAYLRFNDERRPARYALATGWFVLALLTKTITATLPAALLVILWWRRGRLDWRRDVLPLVPWFAVGAAAGLFTASFERTQIGASGADFDLSVIERILLAGRVAWFYLGKLLWPANLTFIYPRWTITAESIGAYVFPIATIALLVVLFRRRRQNRGLLATALLFGGMLFPVLGFVNVYPFLFSFVADHFQYMAALAVFALAGVCWARLPQTLRRATALLVPLALAMVTWRQAGFYRDDFALYGATLARNPTAWLAHNNLGMALVNTGRPSEALPHFELAVRLRRRFAEAENNLGDCLTRLGRAQDAIPHLERALQLQPKYAEAHNNLGVACMAAGRSAEGIVHFEQATRLKPDYAVSHFNLGLAIASRGRPEEATAHFARAAELDPHNAEAQLNWAIALTLTNRFDQALPHFERALALRPRYAEAEMKFGRALATVGRIDEAIARYRKALELEPGSADTHLNLAVALRRVGRAADAERHLAEAQRLSGR
jgi:Flp pilus assembly protein TadD